MRKHNEQRRLYLVNYFSEQQLLKNFNVLADGLRKTGTSGQHVTQMFEFYAGELTS
jgi:hypothetical protein